MMKRIAVFASGSGTNAENLINYFRENSSSEVIAVFTENPNAGVIERGKKLHVPVQVFKMEEFKSGQVLGELRSLKTDLVVLAGFLKLVPPKMVEAFPNKIINIHPALLPNYGGKGMYGSRVHEAVIKNKEKMSGITIHLVNEKYDEGAILYREAFLLKPNETPATLAQRIHQLEYKNFPKVVDYYLEFFLKSVSS